MFGTIYSPEQVIHYTVCPIRPIGIRWSSTEWFGTATVCLFGGWLRLYNVAYLCGSKALELSIGFVLDRMQLRLLSGLTPEGNVLVGGRGGNEVDEGAGDGVDVGSGSDVDGCGGGGDGG